VAYEHNSPMPALDTAHHNLLTAHALHTAQARPGSTSFPVLDWSALIAGTCVTAGLDTFDSGTVLLFLALFSWRSLMMGYTAFRTCP